MAAKMAAKMAARMELVLGTMEMGRDQRETASVAASLAMIEAFAARGGVELDTAILYNQGRTQEIMGQMSAELKRKVRIATKVNPAFEPFKSLRPDSVRAQFEQSLRALGVDSVDMLYLHWPDHQNEITATLEAVNELHRAGKFKRFALSNYAAWEVMEIYHICKQRGFVLPTVYQGMYNALTRDVERELFPCLRRLGMSFYAYNPLAGGLLTGRYSYDDLQTQPIGRFFGNHWAANYVKRYWHREYFDAVEDVRRALVAAYGADASGAPVVSMAEAAIRWMMHHSKMSAELGDKVILGCSRLSQLEQNLKTLGAGPLDARVVEAYERGWERTRANCVVYYR